MRTLKSAAPSVRAKPTPSTPKQGKAPTQSLKGKPDLRGVLLGRAGLKARPAAPRPPDELRRGISEFIEGRRIHFRDSGITRCSAKGNQIKTDK